MKNTLKGKDTFKKIRLFSTAILLLSAVSFKAHSQNYPAPGQPTNPSGYPNQNIPNTPTPNPALQTPTTPTTPTPTSTPTQPNSPQLHQDTMHLYNPVKPDTGHLKLQGAILNSSANSFNLALIPKEKEMEENTFSYMEFQESFVLRDLNETGKSS